MQLSDFHPDHIVEVSEPVVHGLQTLLAGAAAVVMSFMIAGVSIVILQKIAKMLQVLLG